VVNKFQEGSDAEDSEVRERRCRFHAERTHGRGEYCGAESHIGSRSERSPQGPGLERPHPCGPRRNRFSRELRNGWHQAQELSGLRPRMDFERTTSELAKPVRTTKGVFVRPALKGREKPRTGVVFPAAILQCTVHGRSSSEQQKRRPHSYSSWEIEFGLSCSGGVRVTALKET